MVLLDTIKIASQYLAERFSTARGKDDRGRSSGQQVFDHLALTWQKAVEPEVSVQLLRKKIVHRPGPDANRAQRQFLYLPIRSGTLTAIKDRDLSTPFTNSARQRSAIMPVRSTKVLPNGRLTLKDRLSRLTFSEASKLLGPDGAKQIQRYANSWEFKLEEHVFLGNDLFRLRFPDEWSGDQALVVTITLKADARNRLHFRCNRCQRACEHVAAAISLILEEKLALGLAAAPRPRTPIESLAEEELLQRAVGRARRARANGENDGQGAGPRPALVRLSGHQSPQRQDLSCGAARRRARRFVLFLPGFSHQHAGYVQARFARVGQGETTVHPSAACPSVPSEKPGAALALCGPGHVTAASARKGRRRGAAVGRSAARQRDRELGRSAEMPGRLAAARS